MNPYDIHIRPIMKVLAEECKRQGIDFVALFNTANKNNPTAMTYVVDLSYEAEIRHRFINMFSKIISNTIPIEDLKEI